jgi:hypothetical protein
LLVVVVHNVVAAGGLHLLVVVRVAEEATVPGPWPWCSFLDIYSPTVSDLWA